MKEATVNRKTAETDISLTLSVNGQGRCDVSTPSGFFDHMLAQLCRHGMLDISLKAFGDIGTGLHHTVEDCGIALGQALDKALGDRAGIRRYGFFLLPMDEALVQAALDISGRACLKWNVPMPAALVGDFDSDLAEEFFTSLCRAAGLTLHITLLSGSNTHHIIEGVFKCFGRALRQAVSDDPALSGGIPSTKNLLKEADI